MKENTSGMTTTTHVFGDVEIVVYRPILTAEERKSIHGNNEKIRLESIAKATEFYIRLIGKC